MVLAGAQDDVVADDNLAQRGVVGVAGKRDRAAEPFAADADGEDEQRKRGKNIEDLHHEGRRDRAERCAVPPASDEPVPAKPLS